MTLLLSTKKSKLDIADSLVPLRHHYSEVLLRNEVNDVSPMELIGCWVKSEHKIDDIKKMYDLVDNSKRFYRQVKRVLRPYEETIPENVELSTLAQWTYTFFESREDQGVAIAQNSGNRDDPTAEKVLGLQQVNEEEFAPIFNFYKDAFKLLGSKEEDVLANKCVMSWRLAGFKFNDLKLMATGASAIETCFNDFMDKTGSILEQISCLLPAGFDAQRLVRLTVVYFRGAQAVEESIEKAANSRVKKLRIAEMRKTLRETILADDISDSSRKKKIDKQYDLVKFKLFTQLNIDKFLSELGSFMDGVSGLPGSVLMLAFKYGLLAKTNLLNAGPDVPRIVEEIVCYSMKLSPLIICYLPKKRPRKGKQDKITTKRVDFDDDDFEEEFTLRFPKPSKKSSKSESESSSVSLALHLLKAHVRNELPKISFGGKVKFSSFIAKNDDPTGFKVKLSKDKFYPLDCILVLLRHIGLPHEEYSNSASQKHSGITLVCQDDFAPIKQFFEKGSDDKGIVDKSKKAEVMLIPKDERMRRLQQNFASATKSRDISQDRVTIPKAESPGKFNVIFYLNLNSNLQLVPGFQDLFEKYFCSLYNAGMSVQRSHAELSKIVAGRLIECWVELDFTMEKLLDKVSNNSNQKSTFFFLMDKLMVIREHDIFNLCTSLLKI